MFNPFSGRMLLRLALPVVLALALAACNNKQTWHLANVTHVVAPLQFSGMQSTRKNIKTAKDLRGKVVMVYFGYTHCPDICPVTLAKMVGVIRKLGPEAKKVRLLFVSVDPQRDTIPVMKKYLAAFDQKHFIGLRGTPKQTRKIAKRYRVAYNHMPPDKDGSYIVNHSSAIFIFGPEGNARLLGTNINSASEYVADLKQLISDS